MPGKIRGLFRWCLKVTEGYEGVELLDMTYSWKNGLAFCAIINRFRPDLIDFYSLSPDNVYDNNNLAYSIMEREFDVPRLLDPTDMVEMDCPDRYSIATYVSAFYECFNDKPMHDPPPIPENWAANQSKQKRKLSQITDEEERNKNTKSNRRNSVQKCKDKKSNESVQEVSCAAGKDLSDSNQTNQNIVIDTVSNTKPVVTEDCDNDDLYAESVGLLKDTDSTVEESTYKDMCKTSIDDIKSSKPGAVLQAVVMAGVTAVAPSTIGDDTFIDGNTKMDESYEESKQSDEGLKDVPEEKPKQDNEHLKDVSELEKERLQDISENSEQNDEYLKDVSERSEQDNELSENCDDSFCNDPMATVYKEMESNQKETQLNATLNDFKPNDSLADSGCDMDSVLNYTTELENTDLNITLANSTLEMDKSSLDSSVSPVGQDLSPEPMETGIGKDKCLEDDNESSNLSKVLSQDNNVESNGSEDHGFSDNAVISKETVDVLNYELNKGELEITDVSVVEDKENILVNQNDTKFVGNESDDLVMDKTEQNNATKSNENARDEDNLEIQNENINCDKDVEHGKAIEEEVIHNSCKDTTKVNQENVQVNAPTIQADEEVSTNPDDGANEQNTSTDVNRPNTDGVKETMHLTSENTLHANEQMNVESYEIREDSSEKHNTKLPSDKELNFQNSDNEAEFADSMATQIVKNVFENIKSIPEPKSSSDTDLDLQNSDNEAEFADSMATQIVKDVFEDIKSNPEVLEVENDISSIMREIEADIEVQRALQSSPEIQNDNEEMQMIYSFNGANAEAIGDSTYLLEEATIPEVNRTDAYPVIKHVSSDDDGPGSPGTESPPPALPLEGPPPLPSVGPPILPSQDTVDSGIYMPAIQDPVELDVSLPALSVELESNVTSTPIHVDDSNDNVDSDALIPEHTELISQSPNNDQELELKKRDAIEEGVDVTSSNSGSNDNVNSNAVIPEHVQLISQCPNNNQELEIKVSDATEQGTYDTSSKSLVDRDLCITKDKASNNETENLSESNAEFEMKMNLGTNESLNDKLLQKEAKEVSPISNIIDEKQISIEEISVNSNQIFIATVPPLTLLLHKDEEMEDKEECHSESGQTNFDLIPKCVDEEKPENELNLMEPADEAISPLKHLDVKDVIASKPQESVGILNENSGVLNPTPISNETSINLEKGGVAINDGFERDQKDSVEDENLIPVKVKEVSMENSNDIIPIRDEEVSKEDSDSSEKKDDEVNESSNENRITDEESVKALPVKRGAVTLDWSTRVSDSNGNIAKEVSLEFTTPISCDESDAEASEGQVIEKSFAEIDKDLLRKAAIMSRKMAEKVTMKILDDQKIDDDNSENRAVKGDEMFDTPGTPPPSPAVLKDSAKEKRQTMFALLQNSTRPTKKRFDEDIELKEDKKDLDFATKMKMWNRRSFTADSPRKLPSDVIVPRKRVSLSSPFLSSNDDVNDTDRETHMGRLTSKLPDKPAPGSVAAHIRKLSEKQSPCSEENTYKNILARSDSESSSEKSIDGNEQHINRTDKEPCPDKSDLHSDQPSTKDVKPSSIFAARPLARIRSKNHNVKLAVRPMSLEVKYKEEKAADSAKPPIPPIRQSRKSLDRVSVDIKPLEKRPHNGEDNAQVVDKEATEDLNRQDSLRKRSSPRRSLSLSSPTRPEVRSNSAERERNVWVDQSGKPPSQNLKRSDSFEVKIRPVTAQKSQEEKAELKKEKQLEEQRIRQRSPSRPLTPTKSLPKVDISIKPVTALELSEQSDKESQKPTQKSGRRSLLSLIGSFRGQKDDPNPLVTNVNVSKSTTQDVAPSKDKQQEQAIQDEISFEAKLQEYIIPDGMSIETNLQESTIPDDVPVEEKVKGSPIQDMVSIEGKLQEVMIPDNMSIEAKLQEITIPDIMSIEAKVQKVNIPDNVAVGEKLQDSTIPYDMSIESRLEESIIPDTKSVKPKLQEPEVSNKRSSSKLYNLIKAAVQEDQIDKSNEVLYANVENKIVTDKDTEHNNLVINEDIVPMLASKAESAIMKEEIVPKLASQAESSIYNEPEISKPQRVSYQEEKEKTIEKCNSIFSSAKSRIVEAEEKPKPTIEKPSSSIATATVQPEAHFTISSKTVDIECKSEKLEESLDKKTLREGSDSSSSSDDSTDEDSSKRSSSLNSSAEIDRPDIKEGLKSIIKEIEDEMDVHCPDESERVDPNDISPKTELNSEEKVLQSEVKGVAEQMLEPDFDLPDEMDNQTVKAHHTIFKVSLNDKQETGDLKDTGCASDDLQSKESGDKRDVDVETKQGKKGKRKKKKKKEKCSSSSSESHTSDPGDSDDEKDGKSKSIDQSPKAIIVTESNTVSQSSDQDRKFSSGSGKSTDSTESNTAASDNVQDSPEGNELDNSISLPKNELMDAPLVIDDGIHEKDFPEDISMQPMKEEFIYAAPKDELCRGDITDSTESLFDDIIKAVDETILPSSYESDAESRQVEHALANCQPCGSFPKSESDGIKATNDDLLLNKVVPEEAVKSLEVNPGTFLEKSDSSSSSSESNRGDNAASSESESDEGYKQKDISKDVIDNAVDSLGPTSISEVQMDTSEPIATVYLGNPTDKLKLDILNHLPLDDTLTEETKDTNKLEKENSSSSTSSEDSDNLGSGNLSDVLCTEDVMTSEDTVEPFIQIETGLPLNSEIESPSFEYCKHVPNEIEVKETVSTDQHEVGNLSDKNNTPHDASLKSEIRKTSNEKKWEKRRASLDSSSSDKKEDTSTSDSDESLMDDTSQPTRVKSHTKKKRNSVKPLHSAKDYLLKNESKLLNNDAVEEGQVILKKDNGYHADSESTDTEDGRSVETIQKEPKSGKPICSPEKLEKQITILKQKESSSSSSSSSHESEDEQSAEKDPNHKENNELKVDNKILNLDDKPIQMIIELSHVESTSAFFPANALKYEKETNEFEEEIQNIQVKDSTSLSSSNESEEGKETNKAVEEEIKEVQNKKSTPSLSSESESEKDQKEHDVEEIKEEVKSKESSSSSSSESEDEKETNDAAVEEIKDVRIKEHKPLSSSESENEKHSKEHDVEEIKEVVKSKESSSSSSCESGDEKETNDTVVEEIKEVRIKKPTPSSSESENGRDSKEHDVEEIKEEDESKESSSSSSSESEDEKETNDAVVEEIKEVGIKKPTPPSSSSSSESENEKDSNESSSNDGFYRNISEKPSNQISEPSNDSEAKSEPVSDTKKLPDSEDVIEEKSKPLKDKDGLSDSEVIIKETVPSSEIGDENESHKALVLQDEVEPNIVIKMAVTYNHLENGIEFKLPDEKITRKKSDSSSSSSSSSDDSEDDDVVISDIDEITHKGNDKSRVESQILHRDNELFANQNQPIAPKTLVSIEEPSSDLVNSENHQKSLEALLEERIELRRSSLSSNSSSSSADSDSKHKPDDIVEQEDDLLKIVIEDAQPFKAPLLETMITVDTDQDTQEESKITMDRTNSVDDLYSSKDEKQKDDNQYLLPECNMIMIEYDDDSMSLKSNELPYNILDIDYQPDPVDIQVFVLPDSTLDPFIVQNPDNKDVIFVKDESVGGEMNYDHINVLPQEQGCVIDAENILYDDLNNNEYLSPRELNEIVLEPLLDSSAGDYIEQGPNIESEDELLQNIIQDQVNTPTRRRRSSSTSSSSSSSSSSSKGNINDENYENVSETDEHMYQSLGDEDLPVIKQQAGDEGEQFEDGEIYEDIDENDYNKFDKPINKITSNENNASKEDEGSVFLDKDGNEISVKSNLDERFSKAPDISDTHDINKESPQELLNDNLKEPINEPKYSKERSGSTSSSSSSDSDKILRKSSSSDSESESSENESPCNKPVESVNIDSGVTAVIESQIIPASSTVEQAQIPDQPEESNFMIGREKDPSKSEVARLIQQSLELDRKREELQRQEQERLHEQVVPRDEILERDHHAHNSTVEREEENVDLDESSVEDEVEAEEKEISSENQFSEEYQAGEATPMSMPSGVDTDNSVSSPEEGPVVEVFDLQESSSEDISPDMESQALFVKLKEAQCKNAVLEAELAKLKARLIVLENSEAQKKQFEKKNEEMANRLRETEKALMNARKEINHYQDLLEGSQGQYIKLEKKMSGDFTALEKKYHKAKKLIKEYQQREKDFLAERESLLQQQTEKDQQYNALVKSLKDKIFLLEKDLREAQKAAGLPVLGQTKEQMGQKSEPIVTPVSAQQTRSAPPVHDSGSVLMKPLSDRDSSVSSESEHTTSDLTSPEEELKSEKVNLFESMPVTQPLDTSVSKAKAQVANNSRRPPTKQRSKSQDSDDMVESANNANKDESGLETWIKHDRNDSESEETSSTVSQSSYDPSNPNFVNKDSEIPSLAPSTVGTNDSQDAESETSSLSAKKSKGASTISTVSDTSSGYMVGEQESTSYNFAGTPANEEHPSQASSHAHNQFQSCPIAEWNIEHVRNWLIGVEMDKYIPLFNDQSMTGTQLVSMDANKFKALGITSSKDRDFLKKKVKELKLVLDKERKQLEKERKQLEKEQKLKEKEQKKLLSKKK